MVQTLSGGPLDSIAMLRLPAAERERLGLENCLQLRRIWPRSSERAALEYESGDGRIIAGQWFDDARHLERVAQATARLTATSRAVVAILREPSVLLQAGGADRRLPGLAPLLAQPSAQLLVHRPERRAAVRLREPSEVRYAKVVRPERVHRLVAASRALCQLGAGAFAVPDLVEVDARAGLTVWSALPGISLHHLLRCTTGPGVAGPSGEASLSCQPGGSSPPGTPEAHTCEATLAVGRALRALHRLRPPPNTAVHGAEEETALLSAWLKRVERFAPNHYSACQAKAALVSRALASGRSPAVLLHRDFYDKQVFVDAQGCIGLLDFDTLAVGEAALDIANALAHLELRALQGLAAAPTAEAAALAMLAGYQPGAQVKHRLQAYTDASRLRLACVYACRPPQACQVSGLLARIGQPVPGLKVGWTS